MEKVLCLQRAEGYSVCRKGKWYTNFYFHDEKKDLYEYSVAMKSSTNGIYSNKIAGELESYIGKSVRLRFNIKGIFEFAGKTITVIERPRIIKE